MFQYKYIYIYIYMKFYKITNKKRLIMLPSNCIYNYVLLLRK